MSNEFKPPATFHPLHFLMHAITGILVFLSGITASHLIEEWKRTRPVDVQWQSGQVQTNYVPVVVETFPRPGNTIEIGLTKDGRVFWRSK